MPSGPGGPGPTSLRCALSAGDDDARADGGEVPQRPGVAAPLADAAGAERLTQLRDALLPRAVRAPRDVVEPDGRARRLPVREAHHVLHRGRAHGAGRVARLRVDAVRTGIGLPGLTGHEV